MNEPFGAWFDRRVAAVVSREPVRIDRSVAPPDFRDAGVLIPYWHDGESVQMLFTLRTSHLPSHSGQISFPGGAHEDGDPGLMATALRETEEELGIPEADFDIVGRLDDAWSIHHYVVQCYLGRLPGPPTLRPDPYEVERVIIVDVERLLDPSIYRVRDFEHGGHRFPLHYFDYDGDVIWGLTGGILYGLLRLLRGQELDPRATGLATFQRFLASENR